MCVFVCEWQSEKKLGKGDSHSFVIKSMNERQLTTLKYFSIAYAMHNRKQIMNECEIENKNKIMYTTSFEIRLSQNEMMQVEKSTKSTAYRQKRPTTKS